MTFTGDSGTVKQAIFAALLCGPCQVLKHPGAQRGAQVHHHPLYSVIAGKESDSYEVKTF